MTANLSVSIVIVTVNRADSLDRTLQSLRQVRYENFEVLVVDGPSVDHTQEVVKRHANSIRPFINTVRNISGARNTGIAHAKGDIIVFIDDDAIPEPDWLDHLLAPYADPDVISVGGFIRDPTGYGYQCKYTLVDRYGNAQGYESAADFTVSSELLFSLTGTNFSTRREHLQSIGGYDEEYMLFLDETDVNIRMHDRGWTAVVVPEAEIHHKFEPGYVRQKSPVPRTMYPQLRSKAYFSVVHNRGRKPLVEVLAYLADYIEKEREWKRDLRRNGWADEATVNRLIDEVERGVEDGVYDAMRLPGPVGITPEYLAQGQASAFKPFPFALPAARRLRLCMLAPDGEGAVARGTRALAAEMARRGHEVTVLSPCLDDKPLIDFIDGVWTHRVPFVAPTDEEAKPFAPAPRPLLDYSWSLHREVLRIDGHRQFQVIIAPLADLQALVCLRKCEMPVVVNLRAFDPAQTTPAKQSEREMVREARHILANARGLEDCERALASAVDRSKTEVIADDAVGSAADAFERLCRNIVAVTSEGRKAAAKAAP